MSKWLLCLCYIIIITSNHIAYQHETFGFMVFRRIIFNDKVFDMYIYIDIGHIRYLNKLDKNLGGCESVKKKTDRTMPY